MCASHQFVWQQMQTCAEVLLLTFLLTGHPMRDRCPKLLMLPLNTQLRTNVALLVGSGLVGADLGRVISLAPKALSTRLSVLTQRLSYVREQLGGTMQARHAQRAQGQSACLSAGAGGGTVQAPSEGSGHRCMSWGVVSVLHALWARQNITSRHPGQSFLFG